MAVIGVAVGLAAWFQSEPADTPIAPPPPPEVTEAEPTGPLRADDPVRTVSVKLSVGPSDADLKEQVALDLGLGFPFWLAPLGANRIGGAVEAMPQTGPTESRLKAGASATFTFSATGDPGRDVLRTSQPAAHRCPGR